MTVLPASPVEGASIGALRARVEAMQGGAERRPVATHRALDGLLTLRSGGVYAAGAPTLAMLLMAGPSAAGAWCAVVGAPDFGAQAAAELGVDLERVVAVPRPQVDPVAVVAALVDVVDVVVVAPGSLGANLTTGGAARLAARLRERHCLIVTWGGAANAVGRPDARLDWSEVTWHGLGRGHGHLQARQATIAVHRSGRLVGRRRLWLPDHDLRVHEVEPVTASALRSVG